MFVDLYCIEFALHRMVKVGWTGSIYYLLYDADGWWCCTKVNDIGLLFMIVLVSWIHDFVMVVLLLLEQRCLLCSVYHDLIGYAT